MSRVLHAAAVSSAFSQTTTQAWFILLKIYKAGVTGLPLYYVNNWSNVTGPSAQPYTAWPFEIALPESVEGRPPEVHLRIDNVDRTLIAIIRGQVVPVSVDINLVLSGTPTVVEAGPFTFTMREINYDVSVIDATLTYERLYDEAFPAHCMTPYYFPALFGQISTTPPRDEPAKGHGGPKYVYARAKKVGT
jgi:hypothetical protein